MTMVLVVSSLSIGKLCNRQMVQFINKVLAFFGRMNLMGLTFQKRTNTIVGIHLVCGGR